MKFRATFKSPDSVHDGVYNALKRKEMLDDEDLHDSLMDFSKQFVWHGEFITVEFDTELGTCTVIPVSGLR